MTCTIKETFAVSLLILNLAVSAAAGPLEDGNAAYKRRDYTTAMRILRPLAEQGDGMAQTTVGLMYYFNYGVPQDYVFAHMWLNLAAARGKSLAALFMQECAAKMTSAQIAEAQRLAREWKPASMR